MSQTATVSTPDNSEEEIVLSTDCTLASATDERGIIRFANPAFQDVSGFGPDQLIGSPHKIVRHPDMPRGVFHLFWDRLKAGLPVCTYVKNRSADGRFYWVFATVTKTETGFISVRIKPQADLFELTREIYADLLIEEASGLTPEKSGAAFAKHLQNNGFERYELYMSQALHAEFSKLNISNISSLDTLRQIDDLTQLIDRAEALITNISDIFSQVGGEPINLRILAGRMEEAGAAIGTISKNYEAMAADMHHLVERLNGPKGGILVRMRDAIDRGRCSAQLAALMELIEQQSQHGSPDQQDNWASHELLQSQSQNLNNISRIALSEINTTGQSIPDTCRQLRRRINGLDLVKLLCRVESGRLGNTDNGLNGIIQRLEDAHNNTDLYLSELAALSFKIHSCSNEL